MGSPYQIVAFIIILIFSLLLPVIQPLSLVILFSQSLEFVPSSLAPLPPSRSNHLSSVIWWWQKLPNQSSGPHFCPFNPFFTLLLWLFLKTNSVHVNFRLSQTSFSSSNGQSSLFSLHKRCFLFRACGPHLHRLAPLFFCSSCKHQAAHIQGSLRWPCSGSLSSKVPQCPLL